MTGPTTGPRPSDRFIPWCIVAFFVAQALLFAWFTYVAKTTYTGLVTEQAYEKGLAYNRTIEKADAQAALGLNSRIEYSNGQVVFSLRDRDERPVSGAKVTGVFFRPVHDGMDVSFEMKEDSEAYRAAISPPEKGLWEVRLRAVTVQGEYQASQRIVVE